MATADLKEPRRQIAPPRDHEDDRYSIVIPTSAMTMDGFRAWSSSDDFPEHGRITFLGNEIIVDMNAERIYSHGQVKFQFTLVLGMLVHERDLGEFYPDGARVMNTVADVSNEPDAMFARWSTLKDGLLRRVPTADQQVFIEMEGTPDWVVEIVSPSSVQKDTIKLRERYERAGIPEYWLVDARKEEIVFEILQRGPSGYKAVRPREGWRRSKTFDAQFRFVRYTNPLGVQAFRLEKK